MGGGPSDRSEPGRPARLACGNGSLPRRGREVSIRAGRRCARLLRSGAHVGSAGAMGSGAGQYERARTAWTSDDGPELSLNWPGVAPQERPSAVVKDLFVERQALSRRIEELRSSATAAGGLLL